MLLRRFTDFVLQGRVQAMSAAFLLAFIPVIGTVSILIATLVTLRKGAFEGALVLIASTLPLALSYAMSGGTEDMSFTLVILVIMIFSNILTWFFAVILERFNTWNFTLELAALLGVLSIGVIHMLYPDVQTWWEGHLTTYFAKTVEMADKISASDASSAEARAMAVAAIKPYATGFVTVAILSNALLQLLIARWWQAAMFNPGGLRQELHRIRLGHVAGVIFVLGILLAYVGNEFALDSMPVLYVTFFVAGLSVIHYFLKGPKWGWIGLGIIYLGVIWMAPFSIIMIAMLALFDTGFDFRKRLIL